MRSHRLRESEAQLAQARNFARAPPATPGTPATQPATVQCLVDSISEMRKRLDERPGPSLLYSLVPDAHIKTSVPAFLLSGRRLSAPRDSDHVMSRHLDIGAVPTWKGLSRTDEYLGCRHDKDWQLSLF